MSSWKSGYSVTYRASVRRYLCQRKLQNQSYGRVLAFQVNSRVVGNRSRVSLGGLRPYKHLLPNRFPSRRGRNVIYCNLLLPPIVTQATRHCVRLCIHVSCRLYNKVGSEPPNSHLSSSSSLSLQVIPPFFEQELSYKPLALAYSERYPSCVRPPSYRSSSAWQPWCCLSFVSLQDHPRDSWRTMPLLL